MQRGKGMEKIDLVYLWCDGSDESWLAKKNKYAAAEGMIHSAGNEKCRFVNNDELKYSLRSVARFAPWVNNIFIVTDHQVPQWLDTSHPQIHMVSHEDIMPADALPTFNSTAIECCLHSISGLSEYFIFANDDMLFGAPTEPSFFFTKEGKPVIRLKKCNFKKYSQYNRKLLNAIELIREKYGYNIGAEPHHNIDAYRKSLNAEVAEIFAPQYTSAIYSRFRKDENIQRHLISLYALAEGKGVLKMVKVKIKKSRAALLKAGICRFLFPSSCRKDSGYLCNLTAADVKTVPDLLLPHLFCINDTEKTTDENRKNARLILEKLFPDKSPYEK